MNKRIWKIPLVIRDGQFVVMPKDAKIMCVQVQDGIANLWAMVDPNNDDERRRIEIFGTGQPIDNQSRIYLGTIQMTPYVWHVFEKQP